MQRNRTYQNPLIALLLVAIFTIYAAFLMSYWLLPPLIGVLFFYFVRALDRQDGVLLIQIIAMSCIIEVALGYTLFLLTIFFVLSYYIAIPRLKTVVNTKLSYHALLILYAYAGSAFFIYLISVIFALESPSFPLYVLFYILLEFLFVSLI